jgi:hypothetical protein
LKSSFLLAPQQLRTWDGEQSENLDCVGKFITGPQTAYKIDQVDAKCKSLSGIRKSQTVIPGDIFIGEILKLETKCLI